MVYVICVVVLFCCLLSIGLFCERMTKIEAKNVEGFPQYPVDGFIHKTDEGMYMYHRRTNRWLCLSMHHIEAENFPKALEKANYKNKVMGK